MELQSKGGVCIVSCFEWNDFGASGTMQMVYQFGKKYYADFKGNVVSFDLNGINNKIVLCKFSDLLWFRFVYLNLIQVAYVKYMPTLRKE